MSIAFCLKTRYRTKQILITDCSFSEPGSESDKSGNAEKSNINGMSRYN